MPLTRAIRRCSTFCLAVALAVGVAGEAAAAPTWLQPVPLSTPPAPQNVFALGAGTPDVAFDGSGNVVAVWQRLSATDPPVVQVTFRNAGGSFTPATDIGPTAESILGMSNAPHAEVDAAGNALLAFPSPDGRVMLAERAPNGGFSAPAEVSSGTGNEKIDLDMSPSGHAILAWQDGASHIQVRVREPGAGFGPPTDLGLAVGSSAVAPQVAVNDQGAGVVAWVGNDGADDRVRARVRTAGGTFAAAPEQQLSDAGDLATDPDVTIDPQGRATAIWVHVVGGDALVESKQANEGGTFPAATDQVSSTGTDGNLPQVLVDSENTAVAVWNSGATVAGSSRQSGASFIEPQPISAPDANTATPPRLAVDPAGNFLAIWAPTSLNASIQAARRPKGGVFGGVDSLPRIATDTLVWGPAVAFDDQGNALALWSSGVSGGNWTVYGTAYDVAPPTLGAVSVPGTGVAGQPIGMAAAATDRWSPVSISWSFGDGTSGAGDAVSHAFGAAGAFTVTATATDAVGNASSAARSVIVAAAPPPPEKRITSKVRVTWGVSGKRIFLLRLSAGSVPKGGKLELRCKGKRCPYKKRSAKKRRNGRITLFKEIKAKKAATKKKRSFRAKQTLEVRITAKGYIGKVVRYKLKKGKIPSGKTLCLPVGKSKPRTRCP